MLPHSAGRMTSDPPPTDAASRRVAVVAVGRWRTDASADTVSLDGHTVKLQPRTMRLLMALADRPGEVCTSEALLDAVWPGVIVTGQSLYQRPNRARAADARKETPDALQRRRQRRHDRHVTDASLSEPAYQLGWGIVGEIGERTSAHPVCEIESSSTLPVALPLINDDGEQAMAARKQEVAVFPNAAGIDVGATSHWVAVPPGLVDGPVREFGPMTTDLNELADWLLTCGVDTVALESTGVYWIPVYEVLEQHGLKGLAGRCSAVEVRSRTQERHPGLPVAAEAHEPGTAARGLAT